LPVTARLATLGAAAQTATARAEDLKTALDETQTTLRTKAAELSQERERHARIQERMAALTLKYATAQAQTAQVTAELAATR
jgi:chromosome segregation ATPase